VQNINTPLEKLSRIVGQLDDTTMPLIDFDQLKEVCSHVTAQAEELALPRDDYIKRINGMVKAIAVCDRKQDHRQQAAETIDALPAMTTAELTACFRRISARFRDCFPASFGLLRSDTSAPFRKRDYQQYK